jgi:hypothetical protein
MTSGARFIPAISVREADFHAHLTPWCHRKRNLQIHISIAFFNIPEQKHQTCLHANTGIRFWHLWLWLLRDHILEPLEHGSWTLKTTKKKRWWRRRCDGNDVYGVLTGFIICMILQYHFVLWMASKIHTQTIAYVCKVNLMLSVSKNA